MRIPQRWERLVVVIAPALLIVVALQQRYHVETEHQTPWAGGGFGMFSTVDVPGGRMVRAYALTDVGPALIIEPQVGVPMRLLYTQPKSERLSGAAQHLAAQGYTVFGAETYREIWPALPELMKSYLRRSPAWQAYLQDSVATPSTAAIYPQRIAFHQQRTPSVGAPVPARVEGARVEVWRPRFDNATNALTWELLNEGSAGVSETPPASSAR